MLRFIKKIFDRYLLIMLCMSAVVMVYLYSIEDLSMVSVLSVHCVPGFYQGLWFMYCWFNVYTGLSTSSWKQIT